ncbi:MAG: hypothetical protein IJ037_01960 [Clostridia bacterium]|nr:hypothetical protein [Clostridia bacterium]MBQ8369513.1 hypothetical protein [Clostridia bacterium]
MMVKLLFLALAVLLVSCGSTVPDDADDIRSFDDLLAFMSGNPENTVTDVILNVESTISDATPVTLSDTDTFRLVSMLTETDLTAERYEPEHIYGGSWYTITFTLSNNSTVVLYPDKQQLMVFRRELNEDQRWYSAPYRLNTDAYPDFYTAVGEIWAQVSDEDPATH